MDFFTHFVFGALMYMLFLKDITLDYLAIAIFFSVLPDLDIFITPLRRYFKSNYLEHRSGSHSYVIGTILTGIIGSIYSIVTQRSFIIVWIIGIVFYGIHVSLDLLTTTKIPCFYPVSRKEYCFYVEKAGSSFTLITSWIFITIFLVVFMYFPEIFLLLLIINTYTYFTLAYYLYRILTKIWISSHLKDNQKYFPGVLPFYFYIFEEEKSLNTFSFLIEKKNHFSRSKVIYKNNSILDSEEMELFKKGMDLCIANYYYAKWTVLPTFFRNEGIFSIRFFFMEPMVRARAMYIQYDFNASSKQEIGYHQSFGRIQS
ncbi:MAG: metal-dependent hydrolase [Candidatus Hodarchaeota archaeon]